MRNQEFFRAGELSWNQDTFIKNQLQHKKEKPRREKITDFLAWKLLKIAFYMRNSGHFSPNQGTFFQFSKKGRGDLPPPRLQLRGSKEALILIQCPQSYFSVYNLDLVKQILLNLIDASDFFFHYQLETNNFAEKNYT